MGSLIEIAADVAQLVEHFLGKEEVTGPIPVVGSILENGRTEKISFHIQLRRS